MFCYKCGNQLEDDAVFCPFCGAKNDDEAENQSVVEVNDNYYDPPQTKKDAPWKLIIFSAVIAAAVIVVFSVGKNRDKDNISKTNINHETNIVADVVDEYAEDAPSAEENIAAEQITEKTTTQTTTAADEQTIPDKVKICGQKVSTDSEELYMERVKSSDMEQLKYMTNLKRLTITGGEITDISALGDLTDLEYLCIASLDITDISVIGKLTNLEEIEIWHSNKLTDISVLGKLTGLEKVTIKFCDGITDISVLGKITSIEMIDIDECNNVEADISDFNFDKLPNLRFMAVNDALF